MHARIISIFSPLLRSSPLRHERFRLFYIGSVGTALGYTMQATVAAWLMATLTPSALMVALVQTASTAPSLLFGLVAGTLADIVDRRRVVLFTQILLLTATLLLGAAALAGMIGPIALLLLTFLVGIGFTFYMPAQQALVNDLVPRTELPRAVALSAVAFNLARAVGPALAGAIAAWLGSGSALLASALFFVWMIVALRGWPKPARSIPGVPETLLAGVRSGLRYLQHSPPLRALRDPQSELRRVRERALGSVAADRPRSSCRLGAGGFGLLLGFFGAGAVVGALWIPRHLQKVSLNTVVSGGYLLWAVAALIIAFAPWAILAVVGTCAAGAAWVSVFASLSAGTQTSAPAWVRARAVATNLVATQASLALGSVVWGVVATAAGTPVALSLSAGAMMLLYMLSRRVRVELGNEADVTMGVQPPELSIAGAADARRRAGPDPDRIPGRARSIAEPSCAPSVRSKPSVGATARPAGASTVMSKTRSASSSVSSSRHGRNTRASVRA